MCLKKVFNEVGAPLVFIDCSICGENSCNFEFAFSDEIRDNETDRFGIPFRDGYYKYLPSILRLGEKCVDADFSEKVDIMLFSYITSTSTYTKDTKHNLHMLKNDNKDL